MTFEQMALSRQSTRMYSDKVVSEETLIKICDIAKNAPSSCNSQPWKLHIFTKEKYPKFNEIIKACQIVNLNKFLDQVNSLIVIEQVYGNKSSKRGAFFTGNDFNSMDIGMLADHICFASLEQGLGTCMIGAFRKLPMKKALGFSLKQRVRLAIAVGYPKDGTPIRKKSRKKLEDVVITH